MKGEVEIMTKEQAQRMVNELTAKSIAGVDQGLGYSRYCWLPLPQDEFLDLLRALEVLGCLDKAQSSGSRNP